MYLVDAREAKSTVEDLGGLGDEAGELRARVQGGQWQNRTACEALLCLSDVVAFDDLPLGTSLAEAAPDTWGTWVTDADVRYAWAVLASRARAKGGMEDASTLIRSALGDGIDGMDPLKFGDCLRRNAYIEVYRGNSSLALGMAEAALPLLEEHAEMEHTIGGGLAACGYVHFVMDHYGQARLFYTRALESLDPEVEFCSSFQVAQATVEAILDDPACGEDQLASAMVMLEELEGSGVFPENSTPRVFLRWSRARLARRSELHEDALSGLEVVHATFLEQGREHELIVSSVDLLLTCISVGDVTRCREVVGTLVPLLGSCTDDFHLRRAFQRVKVEVMGGGEDNIMTALVLLQEAVAARKPVTGAKAGVVGTA